MTDTATAIRRRHVLCPATERGDWAQDMDVGSGGDGDGSPNLRMNATFFSKIMEVNL